MSGDPQVIGLVPAAGVSRRMGRDLPKIFLDLGRELIIQRTLRVLTESGCLNRLVVLAREEDFARLRALRLAGDPDLVAGGSTRQQSVFNGLTFVKRQLLPAGDDAWLLIHDAARCFVSPETVRLAVEAGREHGAVTVARAAVDTLVRTNDADEIREVVDRAGVLAVQTPQVFQFDLLYRAHERARAAGNLEATDDASLVRPLHPVRTVPGGAINFKVTTPEDLELARCLAAGETR